MTDSSIAPRSLPLTDLSEDEQAFREVVRDFAKDDCRLSSSRWTTRPRSLAP